MQQAVNASEQCLWPSFEGLEVCASMFAFQQGKSRAMQFAYRACRISCKALSASVDYATEKCDRLQVAHQLSKT